MRPENPNPNRIPNPIPSPNLLWISTSQEWTERESTRMEMDTQMDTIRDAMQIPILVVDLDTLSNDMEKPL